MNEYNVGYTVLQLLSLVIKRLNEVALRSTYTTSNLLYSHSRPLSITPKTFIIVCTMATSIVHSELDYCNYIFYSINSSQMKHLQTIQTLLAEQSRKLPNITT